MFAESRATLTPPETLCEYRARNRLWETVTVGLRRRRYNGAGVTGGVFPPCAMPMPVGDPAEEEAT